MVFWWGLAFSIFLGGWTSWAGSEERIQKLEKELIHLGESESAAKSRYQKANQLIKLHQLERKNTLARMAKLNQIVASLEGRKEELSQKLKSSARAMRETLKQIQSISHSLVFNPPKKRALNFLAAHRLREMEAYKIDLADATELKQKIDSEKEQLQAMTYELKEQEEILNLHKQIQMDALKNVSSSRVSRLSNYRELKDKEQKVEQLIKQFNARLEFSRLEEAEKAVIASMKTGLFAQMKGQLELPIQGTITQKFGQIFDPKSNMFVFHKGIHIQSEKDSPVRAVFDGKVAFIGALKGYNQVAILDHGGGYYSLCGNLGLVQAKLGDQVPKGKPIGIADASGTPIYFEIRSRNVPVNPLQWIRK